MFIKWFIVPLFLWPSVGCKYYQYRPDVGLDRWEYQTFDEAEWRQVEKGYHFIIHHNTDTLELYNISFQNKVFTGSVKPFTGLPLKYYKLAAAAPGENLKRPFAGESGPATNQIHFFLDHYRTLDSSKVQFALYKDVRNVEFVKQSPKNYLIGTSFALGIVATVYVAIFVSVLAMTYDK